MSAAARPLFADVDFRRAPFLVIWETTQACALACRHCRASARPWRDPLELTTAEGKDLIEQVAGMGTPLLVLSGGDPVNRPDLFELVRHAKSCGLRTATIPAATAELTEELVRKLKDAALDQMALSLDFPAAALHDAFRGVPGAFAKTLQAAEWARAAQLPLQINTTVCGDTVPSSRRWPPWSSGWARCSGRSSSSCPPGGAASCRDCRPRSASACSTCSTGRRRRAGSW